MTTIRSGAPRIASTSATSATSAPATAKSSTPAEVNSSFQAATGGTTGGGAIRQALDAGTKALESLDPSASVDGLKKLFAGGIPTGKQLQAALDNFADITESLSPEQRKSVEKALSTQMQGRSMSDQFRQQLEKLVGEAASRR